MTKYLCVFVLLIAFAATQQDGVGQFTVDSAEPQQLTFAATTLERPNDVSLSHKRPSPRVITFDGEYTTSITNDPDLRIKFSGNQVSIINGCNSFNGQYQAESTGCIKFGPLAGTKRACQVDFDSLYTTALSNSVTFEVQGNRIILRDSRRTITMTLTQYKAPSATPVSLAGKYSTNLLNDPNVTFEFTQNRVSLVGGCNNQGGEYKALSDGSFSVSQFFSTLKACQIDNDSVYTRALSQSTSFARNSDGSITFRNSKGQITVILIPFSNRPKEIKLEGTYRPSITQDSDLLIRLEQDGKVTFLNGCNSVSGTYKAFEDGSISFSAFASTRKFCPDDKDSIYANALSNSIRFVIQASRIILSSSSGRQTIILTPIGIVPPTDPSGCKVNEVLTPSGCWNSCSDPRFKQCPDVFAALFRPEFCAYTRDGKYVSETFQCQACQRQDAFAVRKGACSCDFIKCGSGEVCQNGQCVRRFPIDPLPCNKLCIQGTVCRNGQCVPETPVDKCALIRCGFGTVCRDGQCVQPNPIDNCAAVTCPFGTTCRNGKCVQEPVNPCSNVRCPEGTTCQNGQCIPVDRCSLVRCGRGEQCKNGECIPIKGFCGNSICAEGFICSNNRCVPCHQEQPDQCISDLQCRNGETCENRRCVPNKCYGVKCFQGSRCDNGKCVPDIQSLPPFNRQLPSLGLTTFPSIPGSQIGGFGTASNVFSQAQSVIGSLGQINQNGLGPFNQNSLGPFNQNGFGPFNGNSLGPFNQNGLSPFNNREPAGEVCGTSICRLGTFCQNGRCVALVPQNFPSSSGTQTPVSDCSLCPANTSCLNNVCYSS